VARKSSKKPAAKARAAAKPRPAPARSKPSKSSRPSPAKPSRPAARKPAARMPAARTSSRKAPAALPPAFPPPPLNDAALAKLDSGLSKKELSEFRETLLQRRAQMVGDVTTMRDEALSRNRQDAAGDLSNMPLHMADVGTDNYEQEFTLGLIESERQLLREIDDALLRIKAGTFGVCAATGEPIGRARLRATPWAKYCYEYVLAQERGRRPRV
jgi:RNA polymerase-binding protein DksA